MWNYNGLAQCGVVRVVVCWCAGLTHASGSDCCVRTVRCCGILSQFTIDVGRTAVAQWLRCCATNRKVAGSIPAGVSGFFH